MNEKVTITEFLNNMKYYAEIVLKEDILIERYGKPIFVISDPAKYKMERMKKLKGILNTDIPYEIILEVREF